MILSSPPFSFACFTSSAHAMFELLKIVEDDLLHVRGRDLV